MMQQLHRLPAANARKILEFVKNIQSDTVQKGKGWFTLYSDEINKMNASRKELIKQDLVNAMNLPTNVKHLNAELFQAEMGICHKFQQMQILLDEESQAIKCEEGRLQNEILDTNSGVLSNMAVIHRVLFGETATHPTDKGLLEMWSEGIYDNMTINTMSLKLYQDYVEKYLEKASILQFKGSLLYAAANVDNRVCMRQFQLLKDNLKFQIEKMEKTMPPFLTYMTNLDEEKGFTFKAVLDGEYPPFIISKGLNKNLGYDYTDGNTKEKQWNFKKAPRFEEDGSLLISGSSEGDKRYYVSVSGNDKAQCVPEECRATPFYVIPLDFTDKIIKILFYKSDSKQENTFLGNSLTCIGENDVMEFTLSFDCN